MIRIHNTCIFLLIDCKEAIDLPGPDEILTAIKETRVSKEPTIRYAIGITKSKTVMLLLYSLDNMCAFTIPPNIKIGNESFKVTRLTRKDMEVFRIGKSIRTKRLYIKDRSVKRGEASTFIEGLIEYLDF